MTGLKKYNKLSIYSTWAITKLSEKNLFVALAVIGFFGSFFFRANLEMLPYQFGIETIGLFISPFLTGVYILLAGLKSGFKTKVLFWAILLFVITILPFSDLLFRVVLPNPGEDFERNLTYAQNMIEKKTLWGGDRIAYPDEGNAYITQPGYRYFVAFELLVFGGLYRFVSIVNILFFIISFFFFLRSVELSIERSLFQSLLLIFLVLTIPYATKNILLGLSEWLMVSILMWSVYFFRVHKFMFMCILMLALVSFIRQNTLPAVLLLTMWIIFRSKHKVLLFFLFLTVLLLPVYHNLYFSGEWRFFVSIYHWPFLSYESSSKYVEPSGINYLHIGSNFLHYFGIHIRGNGIVDFLEEAFLFLVPFTIIYFFIQKVYFSGYLRILFLMITLSVIIPTVFFATDFYPRFEFVCVYFSISTFLFLYEQKKWLLRSHDKVLLL